MNIEDCMERSKEDLCAELAMINSYVEKMKSRLDLGIKAFGGGESAGKLLSEEILDTLSDKEKLRDETDFLFDLVPVSDNEVEEVIQTYEASV